MPLLSVLSLTRQLTCHKMEHSKSLDDRRCGPDNGRLFIMSCIKEDTRVWYRTGDIHICVNIHCLSHMSAYHTSHMNQYHMSCHMYDISVVRAGQHADMMCYDIFACVTGMFGSPCT